MNLLAELDHHQVARVGELIITAFEAARDHMSAWRSFRDDPPKADGRRILAWAKLTADEYDDNYMDGAVPVRKNAVSYYPAILHSMPPFVGWAEFGNRYVQNAEYLYWQDIVPPDQSQANGGTLKPTEGQRGMIA